MKQAKKIYYLYSSGPACSDNIKHHHITLYEPRCDGKFSEYNEIGSLRAQSTMAGYSPYLQREEAGTLPYGWTFEAKLEWGNPQLCRELINGITATPGSGTRRIIRYLRKHGERYVHAQRDFAYLPYAWRKHEELYFSALESGVELMRRQARRQATQVAGR
jgi:hypothetical protein